MFQNFGNLTNAPPVNKLVMLELISEGRFFESAVVNAFSDSFINDWEGARSMSADSGIYYGSRRSRLTKQITDNVGVWVPLALWENDLRLRLSDMDQLRRLIP